MFPTLENNNGEGASQQDTEAAGQGTEACMTPNADNGISVPATTLETPSDITRSQEASVSGEESEDNNNAIDTPRKHHTPTSFLESKIEELQTRLAQLESQAEEERHEKQVLERMVMEGSRPITALSFTHSIDQMNSLLKSSSIRRLLRIYGFRDMEDDFESYDDEDHMRSRGYLSRAISAFERELKCLHNEKKQEDRILGERDERVKRMQVTWDEEKEKLLQRQHKLEQLCRKMRRGYGININSIDESDTDSQQQLAHTEEDVSSSSPAVNEIPELKYLDWHDYNKRQLFDAEPVGISATSPQRYAIDILEGEPVIIWERPNIGSFGFGRNKRTSLYPTTTESEKAAKPRKPTANVKSSHVQGQPPLPERIRINSMHIVKILAKIRGDSEGLDHTPLVMIRPYKALAYYDEAIQSEFRKLQAKFGENYAAADDVSTAEGKESKTGEDDRGESDVTAKSEVERKTDMPTDSSVEKETDSEGSEPWEYDEDEEFTSSVTAYKHLSCLVQFMDKHLRNKIKYLARDPGYPGCQTVSFGEIWHLFQPGDEVIEQSRRQVYRIISISSAPHRRFSPFLAPGSWLDKEAREQEATPVVLCCVYMDFDGKRLGPKIRKVRIARFDGEKAVTKLEVYPLSFAETGRKLADGQLEGTQKVKQSAGGPPTLREKLIARGRMFIDVTAIKHMHYSGLTVDTREEVDGDVVVDFEQAFSHDKTNKAKSLSTKEDADDTSHQHVSDTEKPDWQPSLDNLLGNSLEEEFDDADCGAPCCNAPGAESETIHKDAYAEEKRNKDYMSLLMPEDRRREPPPTIYPRLLSEIKAQEHALTEDDLLIMSYRVFGFILRNRKWGEHLSLP